MKKTFFWSIFIWLTVVFLFVFDSSASAKGISVVSKEGQTLRLYDDYQAVVVGVSNYVSWPKLPNATKDAEEVAEQLNKMGFTVKLVTDPTYRQLQKTLSDLAYDMGNKADRALLFYYAGHGETEKSGDSPMGYIIPADCPVLSDDPTGFHSRAISMKEIETASTRMKARHVIMLFDACFSGSVFALGRPVPEDITKKSNMPVRQYIIAGRPDETSPEESMFKRCFLMSLNGYADLNDDGYITGTELAMYLSDIVANTTHRKQHPQYGKNNHAGLDQGDFVFAASTGSEPEMKKAEKPQQASKKKADQGQSALDQKIRELEATIKEAKALKDELKEGRGGPSSDGQVMEEKGAASQSSPVKDLNKQIQVLQDQNRMLEEENKRLRAQLRERKSGKMPDSRVTEGYQKQIQALQDRNRMLEAQYERLKAERHRDEVKKTDDNVPSGVMPHEVGNSGLGAAP
ncbi:MAG: caspase family protein [Deltaproteobacteria bacterium]|nr:caspase family protein [Deltaproteobacteria bacterium]